MRVGVFMRCKEMQKPSRAYFYGEQTPKRLSFYLATYLFTGTVAIRKFFPQSLIKNPRFPCGYYLLSVTEETPPQSTMERHRTDATWQKTTNIRQRMTLTVSIFVCLPNFQWIDAHKMQMTIGLHKILFLIFLITVTRRLPRPLKSCQCFYAIRPRLCIYIHI